MNPGDIAPLVAFIIFAVGVSVTVILRGPLGKALARRLEGKAGTDEGLEGRLQGVEERLEQIELHQGHMAELEERVDFAERLLARGARPEAPQ